jgi:MoxR-like ATPase
MQLANLLTPIFHESMREVELGVKILLSGPPGCGKMEISRAACDMLGVDLIEANVSSLTLARYRTIF